jgi:hypothetical protein
MPFMLRKFYTGRNNNKNLFPQSCLQKPFWAKKSLKSIVAEPHHFYAAPALNKNFYAAPAALAPAPTLMYSKAKY